MDGGGRGDNYLCSAADESTFDSMAQENGRILGPLGISMIFLWDPLAGLLYSSMVWGPQQPDAPHLCYSGRLFFVVVAHVGGQRG